MYKIRVLENGICISPLKIDYFLLFSRSKENETKLNYHPFLSSSSQHKLSPEADNQN